MSGVKNMLISFNILQYVCTHAVRADDAISNWPQSKMSEAEVEHIQYIFNLEVRKLDTEILRYSALVPKVSGIS